MKYKKFLNILLILLFFAFPIFSQQSTRTPLVAYLQDGLWHILDENGKEMFKPMDIAYIGGYSEGFFTIREKIGQDTVWGFMNLSGKMAVPPGAKYLSLFHNGFAIYSTWQPGLEDIKYFGYIRNDGIVLTLPSYLDATVFNEGYAFVMNYAKRGYIDTTGKMIKEFKFGFGEPFYEGFSVVQDSAGHFGYIDKNFQPRIPLTFDEAHNFSQGLARVNKDGYFGYIDTTGLLPIPAVFVMATDFKESRAFVARAAKLDSIRYAVISSGGKLLTDFIFGDVRDFSQGIAAVRENDNWYFINLMGERFNKQNYAYADSFVDGIAYVKEQKGKKRRGYINIAGKFQVIIPQKATVIFDLRLNRLVE